MAISPPNVSGGIRSLRPADLYSNIMFFSRRLIDGQTTNLADRLVESIKGVFVETDEFFRFRINPSRVTIQCAKILTRTRTKLQFEWSHFGNQVTVLNYDGTTGYFRPPNILESAARIAATTTPEGKRDEIASLILSGDMDIRQSPVWQKFRRFEQFYQRINDGVVMYYDGRIFEGQITRFQYTEDANDPLQIRYTFSFEAQTDLPTGEDRLGGAIVQLGAP